MQEVHENWVIKISKFISNFFNPIVALLIFLIYFGFTKLSKADAIEHLLLMLFIVAIPVFLWIYWNVKTGRYTNMDVSDRKQRKTLYVFMIINIIIYLLIVYFFYYNVDILLIIGFLLLTLLVMQFSNLFIKSSMHMSLNVFVAALFTPINPLLGFIWLIVAIIVGVTRVILKRHTVKEVVMGGLIATVVSSIYLYLQIYL